MFLIPELIVKKFLHLNEEILNATPRGFSLQSRQVTTAFLHVTTTIDDSLIYLIVNKPRHPAVAIAALHEHFDPSGVLSKNELFKIVNSPDIRDHGGDFTKVAAEIERAGRELREQGENISDDHLRNSILESLKPPEDYELCLAIAETLPNLREVKMYLTTFMQRKTTKAKIEHEGAISTIKEQYAK